jgi:hypothetical protein
MYTVWVGGTEVTDNYVDFEKAKTIHDSFKENGHNDIIVQFEEVDPKIKKSFHVEMGVEFVVDHDQVITCNDCAYDDGHLRPSVSCECGRSNDDNTPIGEYDFGDDDPDAQTDREVQTEHWNSERLSE